VVTDEFGRCATLGDVVQKRIDKLFIRLDWIHICSVGLSTNKELSRGNATIDRRSVRPVTETDSENFYTAGS
jgi:hypothetical protein